MSDKIKESLANAMMRNNGLIVTTTDDTKYDCHIRRMSDHFFTISFALGDKDLKYTEIDSVQHFRG